MAPCRSQSLVWLRKNYRGITINPNISKLFARIFLNRLISVVEAEKMLGEFQGATRSGRHTTDNIFILSVMIEKARKSKLKDTSAAFIDMRKAYDMVDREKLYVDHGPAGIASTLAQNHQEGDTPRWKAVHHMSRSLVKSEMNYNKIEGESLAIYSGVLMNRKYLMGAPFTTMTDHSSLPAMYNCPSRPAPHRVDRHRGRLGVFDMKVEFVPGHKMPCDYGSRHPDKLPENLTKEQREEIGIETEEDMEVWLGAITQQVLPAITMQQLQDDTDKDPELKPLLEEKKTGVMSKSTSKGPYGKMWPEIRERDGVLMKGDKIIIPKILQPQAIALAHEGHMQADGTLRQLRESQWFRGMRQEVQKFVNSCKCATANPRNPKLPLKLRPRPTKPWEVTACDYKGPIRPQRWYLHTTMCVYSRYPEVCMTKFTGIAELRRVMDRQMRTHGVPKEIWTDGGPPYNGHEWTEFVEDWGSKPRKTTPYHPPANDMVERFNQVLKQTILAAYAEKKDPVDEVDKVVAAYRNTPHTVTGSNHPS